MHSCNIQCVRWCRRLLTKYVHIDISSLIACMLLIKLKLKLACRKFCCLSNLFIRLTNLQAMRVQEASSGELIHQYTNTRAVHFIPLHHFQAVFTSSCCIDWCHLTLGKSCYRKTIIIQLCLLCNMHYLEILLKIEYCNL